MSMESSCFCQQIAGIKKDFSRFSAQCTAIQDQILNEIRCLTKIVTARDSRITEDAEIEIVVDREYKLLETSCVEGDADKAESCKSSPSISFPSSPPQILRMQHEWETPKQTFKTQKTKKQQTAAVLETNNRFSPLVLPETQGATCDACDVQSLSPTRVVNTKNEYQRRPTVVINKFPENENFIKKVAPGVKK